MIVPSAGPPERAAARVQPSALLRRDAALEAELRVAALLETRGAAKEPDAPLQQVAPERVFAHRLRPVRRAVAADAQDEVAVLRGKRGLDSLRVAEAGAAERTTGDPAELVAER